MDGVTCRFSDAGGDVNSSFLMVVLSEVCGLLLLWLLKISRQWEDIAVWYEYREDLAHGFDLKRI
jgi:hypothetical protein